MYRKLNDGKLGVFWHTQVSGKSYSMVFLAQKIRRKFAGSPTIVVLTDRDELNKQISDTFENCGLLGKSKASQFIASSGDDLVIKLKGKQETKAEVDNLIRDTLWAELPESYDEISISEYRQRIYEYVYTRYRIVA